MTFPDFHRFPFLHRGDERYSRGRISASGVNREVLRACFLGKARPVIAEPLFLEYEDVLARPRMEQSPLNRAERRKLLEGFLGICEWVNVYFGWRPNLPDEGDNHLIELAVAGGAEFIVTNNVSDLTGGDLRFPQIRVLRPLKFIKEIVR